MTDPLHLAMEAEAGDVKVRSLHAGASNSECLDSPFYFWHFWQSDFLLEFNKTRQRLSPSKLLQSWATSA